MVDARKLRSRFYEDRSSEELLSQDTRKDIAHIILAHPEESPSLNEIHYVIGGNRANINEHLDKMEETEAIESLTGTETDRDKPNIFYALTDKAEAILEEENLLETEKLKEYENTFKNRDGLLEYTDEQISRYLEASRPE